ncbi:MAG: ThiF family adenylyltransferase [Pseudomonas sp.]
MSQLKSRMYLDTLQIQQQFPDFIPYPLTKSGGDTAYRLKLPEFLPSRGFHWAELCLPKGFPDHARAAIRLSDDALLRVPHVEGNHTLCLKDGDPGPASGMSPEDRVINLLWAFQEDFLKPWQAGLLDGDFETEALNYWAVVVHRAGSIRSPLKTVWTVDLPPVRATLRKGLFLPKAKAAIAADEQVPLTRRFLETLGDGAKERISLHVADIPISSNMGPKLWPASKDAIAEILESRLEQQDFENFWLAGAKRFRLVLLRNKEVAYAYLLPGWRQFYTGKGKSKQIVVPIMKQLPLEVSRIDAAWTLGRDQHPEVESRQRKHVVVFGAGALGSHVVDHLAKAGVGRISFVDPDRLSAANIGRHLLGADCIGKKKVVALASRINAAYPATTVIPKEMTAQRWLQDNSLTGVDLVLDLTGEPDVRWVVGLARIQSRCPLMIGWMEPFVAAAHVCCLPEGIPWMQGGNDPMGDFEAVSWPAEVIRKEPGCSSQFQSYTAASAAHAVALVAENAITMIDTLENANAAAQVVSWVRGQNYLDKHWPGLKLNAWAAEAQKFDGINMIRPFP